MAEVLDLTQCFEQLDFRQPPDARRQALLNIIKQTGVDEEATGAAFSNWITTCTASRTSSDLISAFSAATALFPVLSVTCTALFLTDGFVPGLAPLLKTSRINEENTSDDNLLQIATLELLSAACVNKACRECIQKHCQSSIDSLKHEDSPDVKAYATLVAIKISNGDVHSAVVDELIRNLTSDSKTKAISTECLAYASLKPMVKEQIVNNAALLNTLVKSLQQDTILSTLTIFLQLTAYRPARSEEQKKMAQLKAYANSSKPAMEDPLDNDGMVAVRCQKVLDAGLVSCLANVKELSRTTLEMVAQILNALARESKHRTKMVQAGAIKLILYTAEQLRRQGKSQRTIAHALSRILISVNPEHVFSSAVSATSAVSTIIPLLSPDQEAEQRDLLPTFEALLALTNLASMSDSSVCELIIRSGWSILEDQLLLSSNVLIQRASTELVCNLMLSPSGIAKFANGSKEAARRLHILLALADVEDLATRRAAGGALAMLTEWDTSVTAILDIPRGIEILLSMCADNHDEMRHRGMVCALNCTAVPGQPGIEAIKRLQDEHGLATIQQASLKSDSAEVKATATELLQKLT